MKPYLLLACFVMLLAFNASAQTLIKAVEASKHMGESVFLCDTVFSISRSQNLTTLVLGSGRPEVQSTIVIKGFDLDSNDYSKGQTVCVAGLVKNDSGKPEIEVSDPEMISVHKSILLGRNMNKTTSLNIVKVTLRPPPPAHYFGERYKAISLSDLETVRTDTIKVTETISSYQLMGGFTRIDFGGVYPNQKLTVVLKGEAKKYLDAMLEFEFKNTNPRQILNGMKFLAIGKVGHAKGKPRIVVTNPRLFILIPE